MDDLISREQTHELLSERMRDTALYNACEDAGTILIDIVQNRLERWLNELPSAQKTGEWTNHEVACLLADLFDDTCACNYNGIDEWLPKYCEVIDDCPNPVGVACWEQFLTHRARMVGEQE